MRSKLTKKRMLTLASVLVIALAGIAYGFYSSTGSGSGSGSAAGSDGSHILLTGGTQAGSLVPGGSATVPLTASNTTPSTADGTIRSITGTVAVDPPVTGCQSSWFSIDDQTGLDILVPKDTTSQALTGHDATIHMSSPDGVDQNACKGATLTYTFTTG